MFEEPFFDSQALFEVSYRRVRQRLDDSNIARLLLLRLKLCPADITAPQTPLLCQFTSYFAIRAESTMDMNLVSSESVREVSTTGALVPMTMAASSALASWASVL